MQLPLKINISLTGFEWVKIMEKCLLKIFLIEDEVILG